MVERIVITMKECMAVNNPAGKPDLGRVIGVGKDCSHLPKPEIWLCAKVANTDCGLNVRSEPNVDSKLVAVIPNQDEFNVLQTDSPDWYKSKLKDGTTGFVYSKYVSIIGG